MPFRGLKCDAVSSAVACAKNAVGDRDTDYWLSDLIGETDTLNEAIEEFRREFKKITPPE